MKVKEITLSINRVSLNRYKQTPRRKEISASRTNIEREKKKKRNGLQVYRTKVNTNR